MGFLVDETLVIELFYIVIIVTIIETKKRGCDARILCS